MAKFNPGTQAQVYAFEISRMNKRNLKNAIKAFAKFFNVDNNIEEVVSCAEWWGYTFGNSERYIFIMEDHSEFAKLAISDPSIWDLMLATDHETDSVRIIK